MPSPKSGKAGKSVTPTAPHKPAEADKANPGEMAKLKEQQKAAGAGKYGTIKAVSRSQPILAPFSSTIISLSASPSKQAPKSAPSLTTVSLSSC